MRTSNSEQSSQRVVSVGLDMLLLGIATYVSFVLRLDSFAIAPYAAGFAVVLLLNLVITPAVFHFGKVYTIAPGSSIRPMLRRVVGATLLAAIVAALIAYMVPFVLGTTFRIPLSVPIIYAGLAVFMVVGVRALTWQVVQTDAVAVRLPQAVPPTDIATRVRQIKVEDLLNRPLIVTDADKLRAVLQGKRVLVTGGGGSIGSELCRQVIRCEPSELIILGHGENSVFAIHNELQKWLSTEYRNSQAQAAMPRLHSVIADIRFRERIQMIFEQYHPEVVFHAAAHKHVPLMEMQPTEAATNNVLGTRNVLQAAMRVDVERFVMLSTDKAVNPTSVMGATKRAAELLVLQAARDTGRPYMAVRFGNVLGSRGSVVPTFSRQIENGGPITVTDPNIERFFMTIPEAVLLVLQAAVIGKGGEIFTLDMGEPVKIVDLARRMVELCGLEVGRDIDIVYTGLRPGEKLYEELFLPDEEFDRTVHEKIFIAANASNFVPAHVQRWVDALAIAAERDDTGAILLVLQRLLPQHRLKQAISIDDGPPLARELLEDGSATHKDAAAATVGV